MAEEDLTINNVEQFAQDAIKKYRENDMFLDSIVWQKVVSLLKEKYLGEAIRIRTINDSMDINDPDRMVRDLWFANSYGIAYCQSKADTYHAIKKVVDQYATAIDTSYSLKERDDDLALAKVLLAKHGLA